jgi:hypothetical protein
MIWLLHRWLWLLIGLLLAGSVRALFKVALKLVTHFSEDQRPSRSARS